MTKKDYIQLANTVFEMILQNIDHIEIAQTAYKTAILFCNNYSNFDKEVFDSYISNKIYDHYITVLDQEETDEKVSLFEDTIKYY